LKTGLTNIVFILDKSNSMGFITKDVIDGFNTFLKNQQKLEGEAEMSIVLFSSEVENISTLTNINNIEPLTEKTYCPSGMTALHDAIGYTIIKLGKILDARPESEKPEKVLIIIMTDGDENCSNYYSKNDVKELIDHQTEKYNWEFIYLGANQDAHANSKGIGINHYTNYTTSTSASGIKGQSTAYATLDSCVSDWRCMGDIGELPDSIIED